MDLQPLIEAPQAIQIHVATILLAVLATIAILIARKGTVLHKTTGWVWSTCMMVAAIVSFWIHELDTAYWFSWIHILSVVVIVNIPYAIWSIRRGNVTAHKTAMIAMVIGGIGIAGAFTFMQGRLMHEVLWGVS